MRDEAAPDNTTACNRFDHRIEPYLDGELDPVEQARFERHLQGCAACEHQIALARRVQDALHALPTQTCPPHVSQAALEHARQDRTRNTGWRSWLAAMPRSLWQPSLALAAAAALTVGVLWQRPVVPPVTVDPAVAQAEAEVKLALAYLGRLGVRTGTIMRDDVLDARVASPVVRSVRDALSAQPEG